MDPLGSWLCAYDSPPRPWIPTFVGMTNRGRALDLHNRGRIPAVGGAAADPTPVIPAKAGIHNRYRW